MLITIIIIAVILLLAIGLFNSLVKSKNRVDEAWSDIDVQLKRRHDLIPNLVATVQGYATHEKTVFQNVTEARAQAEAAQGLAAKQKAEDNLSKSIMGIFAVAENYPELKASQNFQQLQSDLTDTEDKIQAARRFYNSNARDYNIKIQEFPGNVIAKMLGFGKRDFFGTEETDKAVPQVSF